MESAKKEVSVKPSTTTGTGGSATTFFCAALRGGAVWELTEWNGIGRLGAPDIFIKIFCWANGIRCVDCSRAKQYSSFDLVLKDIPKLAHIWHSSAE